MGQEDWRTASIVSTNPTPGIWDLHVFGLYAYNQSPYTLDVYFARVTSSQTALDGTSAALANSFDITVDDASYALSLSKDLSTFALSSFLQKVNAQVAEGQKVRVPNAGGQAARTYGPDLATVTLSTGGSTGNDIDLEVLECDDAALATCASAGK